MNAQPLKSLKKYIFHPRRSYSGSKWLSVVGLEVHAQISSNSKLFSGASNEFASSVNSNVSLFDCSIPGTLPVLNKRCVEAAVLTALALNCRINAVSTFDRKHYFYADSPTGYQITQQRSPIANDGCMQFYVYTPGINKKPYVANARIKQLQLEQDSGKSLHEDDCSLVDLNRAGAPLMELVFEPDLQDGEEAASLVKELVTILRRIGSCSCKMEEGALRVDANVSIHEKDEPLGTRTEIKNIGSVRGVAGAIKYEIQRQIKVVESGGTIINETRAWDANGKITVAMRDKEETQDYRYMPEPNLPPLHVAIGPIRQGCVDMDDLQKRLPELPEQTRTRLKENVGLTSEQAIILVNDHVLHNVFEAASLKKQLDPKLLANVLINDYLTFVNKEKLVLEDVRISANNVAEMVEMLQSGVINRNTVKLLFGKWVHGSTEKPSTIVNEEGWAQINDEDEITVLCEEIIKDNEKIVKQYKGGKTKVFKALLGMIAAKTNQRVNMVVATEIFKKLLDK